MLAVPKICHVQLVICHVNVPYVENSSYSNSIKRTVLTVDCTVVDVPLSLGTKNNNSTAGSGTSGIVPLCSNSTVGVGEMKMSVVDCSRLFQQYEEMRDEAFLSMP
jgi:hypothetical protein